MPKKYYNFSPNQGYGLKRAKLKKKIHVAGKGHVAYFEVITVSNCPQCSIDDD